MHYVVIARARKKMMVIIRKYATAKPKIPGGNTPLIGEGLEKNIEDQDIIRDILNNASENDWKENFYQSELESLKFLIERCN